MRILTRLLLVFITLGNSLESDACDVCGGSGNIQGLGLLPQFSSHLAGIQYLYSSSASDHPSLFADKPNEVSAQSVTTLQLWGKYKLSKRFQLFAFLPYVYNNNTDGTQSLRSKGFGDASVIANISIPLAENNSNKRLLLAGAGLKLPTGKYVPVKDASQYVLPNTQAGSGSWDIIGNVNYTVKAAKWGYNIDATYLLTTTNEYQYKFGNRCNISGTAFYSIGQKNLKMLPQCGIRLEYSLHDYDNYEKKWLNEQTGGTMSFISAGAQFFYKKLGLKSIVYIPAYQNYAVGYVHTNTRFETGIFILF